LKGKNNLNVSVNANIARDARGTIANRMRIQIQMPMDKTLMEITKVTMGITNQKVETTIRIKMILTKEMMDKETSKVQTAPKITLTKIMNPTTSNNTISLL
jgi:hypothetical protein